MEDSTISGPPNRITDLIRLKKQGIEVTCEPSFEVIPVDFAQREKRFQAHIFLCRFSGAVAGRKYHFRKCYARGCPHNLCPHVSQAVMIANRYLQRDYRELRQGGIEVKPRLFSLEDMMVKFDDYHEEYDPTLTIDDYINIAKEGNEVTVEIRLEYVPAVEHFASYENAQTFLSGDFRITTLGKTHNYERCFACYPTERERQEKERQILVANARLSTLYKHFDEASVKYQKQFFT